MSDQRRSGRLDVARDLGLSHARIMSERVSAAIGRRLIAATDAGEGDDGAGIGAAMRELRSIGSGIDRLALETDSDGHTHGSHLHLSPRAGRGRRNHPPVIGGKKAISRAPAILVSALTWARSMAARITFGFSNACAYSSPRRRSQSMRSATVAIPAGTSTSSSGLPTRSRTQAKYKSLTARYADLGIILFEYLVGEREQPPRAIKS
jgi:hypothetical protein